MNLHFITSLKPQEDKNRLDFYHLCNSNNIARGAHLYDKDQTLQDLFIYLHSCQSAAFIGAKDIHTHTHTMKIWAETYEEL